MNIHLAYYRNIGPFADQNLLLQFPEGKYMIQSPVGTGKSFLFFDGLIYGLYKHCDRNIVNAKCKDADIYIIFSVENELYMIHRNITATATKTANSSKVSESTKSKLYISKSNTSENTHNIYKNLPNELISKVKGFDQYININDRSSIDFKNETDLNNHLQEFLPLREVFTNRNIFMQDSEDIFTIQEAKRLNIFKNIFGLIDIDKIKEELAGRAREIKGTIAAKKNNDTHNTNFHKHISELRNIYISITQTKPISLAKRFSQNEMFIHKMTIDGLDISEFVIEQDIYDHISASKAKYQDIYTRKQIIDSQITSNQSESQNLKSQITNNIQKKNILTSKFSSIDPKQLETLKSQKNTYIQDRQSSQDIFLSNPKISSLSISTRTDLNIYINNQIQNGKDLKLDLSAIENSKQLLSSNYQNLLLQKQNLEQSEKQSQEHATQLAKSQISSQITNHQNQLTHIAKNLDDKLKQKKILTEKLIALQTDLSAQSKFHCAKIAADCPFIGQINDKVIARTSLNVKSTQDEIAQADMYISEQQKTQANIYIQIENLNIQLNLPISVEAGFITTGTDANKSEYAPGKKLPGSDSIQQISTQISTLDYDNQQTLLQEKIQNLNLQITELRANLMDINYTEIQTKNIYMSDIDQKIIGLDNDIARLELQLADISDIQRQIDQIDSENKLHEVKSENIANIYIGLEADLNLMVRELSDCNIDQISTYEKSINDLSSVIDKIKYIYEQFANDAKALKLLEDEEKIVKNLTNVFGKELMLLVLQEFLPALEDEINSLLTRIVDYEVRFNVLENGDKMEINIKQGHIYREVKSLSGGQKAILRLCWIFAIARRSHNEFLFLDETINNLDADNISAVADMIQDFVAQNQMKFYSITHSQQIQNMSIRDQVINVKEQIT